MSLSTILKYSIFIATTAVSYCWNTTGINVAGITSSSGVASNQLNSPYGIIFDSSNSLFIADEVNNRIQKWSSGGSSGTTVAGFANGNAGTGGVTSVDGLFVPRDVAVDSNGNLYIVDTGYQRVVYWPNGGSTCIIVAGQGREPLKSVKNMQF